jgi:uncharacterized protein (DUF1800 family)
MSFDPIIAATRFGVGLSPTIALPRSVDAMMDQQNGPDQIAQDFPIPLFDDVDPHVSDFLTAHRARVAARGTYREQEMLEAFRALRRRGRDQQDHHFKLTLARWVATQDGLRERLVAFWADHFTVITRNGQTAHMVQPYIETVIRPHVTGRFSDMLRAAVMHPMMLRYLDQVRSMGPNSQAAADRDGRTGLNENLAREVLELHTLGVGGPYTQDDVRQLAELLTGLSYNPSRGFVFRGPFAEPGPETVLGQVYDGDDLDAIHQVLTDLALHPATARHIAQKLAVHFLSMTPPEDLVQALSDQFIATAGDLMAVYQVLLTHSAAWDQSREKVRQPFEFITASLRALGADPMQLLSMTRQDLLRGFYHPLRIMGQTWQTPLGPNGWPEEPEAWITPIGLASRINWAMNVPSEMLDTLPDPHEFVVDALGPGADQSVVFAAQSAEQPSEGIGLVLASAAFNRR